MKSPALFGIFAISIGLVCAAAALYILKPQDRPVTLPGSAPETGMNMEGMPPMDMAPTQEGKAPPVILLLGEKLSPRIIHLALGGSIAEDAAAYRIARSIQQDHRDMALNLIPAMDDASPLYQGFAWALAAGDDTEAQAGFIDGLMGASGDISDKVLTLLAQNNGLDAAKLSEQAKSPEIQQAMSQGRSVLPPTVPALFVNKHWMSGTSLTENEVNNELGQNITQDGASIVKLAATDAYAYATPPTPQSAAIFLNLRNNSATPAVITGANTPVAGRVEIHTHTMEADGTMQMRQIPSFDVVPDGAVSLNPHGIHLMLFELPAPLAVGQKFPLTLILQGGAEISTFVTVTPPGQPLTSGAGSE